VKFPEKKIAEMEYLVNNANALQQSNKTGFFEYFVVLILIFYLGNANILVLFTSFRDQPLIFFVPVFLSAVLVLKNNIQFNRNFFLLIFLYLFYFITLP